MASVLRETSNERLDVGHGCFKQRSTAHSAEKEPVKKFAKGMRIWVHDKNEVWTAASVLDTMKDGRIIVKYADGVESVIKSSKDYPLLYGNVDYENISDLSELSPLHEASVLECLRVRYNVGMYYTQAGITLLAVNPFTDIPHLYTPAKVKLHNSHLIKKKPPHVFAVAEKALRDLKRRLGPVNQSIIVSGESGAGKTWTARCLMRYLATVAVAADGFSPCSSVCRIEKRILNSNPILEAFGNACTTRNTNSSRFGKYIQLQFNRSNHIIGASIKTYLLEKTRVVHQGLGERNFHIFYQLVQGCSEADREDLSLASRQDCHFNYLPLDCYDNHPHQRDVDVENFETTKSAMCGVGLTPLKQRQIFQLLCGILFLGNVSFVSDDDSAGPCEIDEDDAACVLAVEKASSFLGLEDVKILQCLTFRRITASHSRRKSVFMKPCSREESVVRRDCLAKLLYARLFDWLVEFINKNTSAGQSSWPSFIGILDVYGFESFATNSLEQLCINYANEKLQQHFVTHFLKAEQEDYRKEGISWTYCNFTDNRPCLDLLEGKMSVFSLMNEECRLNRQSDSKAFNDRIHDTLHGQSISKPHISVNTPSFIVQHFAGKVTYQAEGLIEKNKDCIPSELIELVRDSDNRFVQQLFHGFSLDSQVGVQGSAKKGKQSAVTVVSKFKSSLDELMTVLNSTSPQYIRCIKPNMQCQASLFDNQQVINQLLACGVLETVNISKAGFPARLSYNEFLDRYKILVKSATKCSSQQILSFEDTENQLPECTQPSKEKLGTDNDIYQSSKHTVAAIMSKVFGEADKENGAINAHFGHTKIFLRDGQLDELEIARTRLLSRAAFTIQCAWKRYRKRKGTDEVIRAATAIQAGWRGHVVRKEIRKMHRAARVIQYALLKFVIQRKESERQRLLELELSVIQQEESVLEELSEMSISLATDSEDESENSLNQSSWESSCSVSNNTDASGQQASVENSDVSREVNDDLLRAPNSYYAGRLVHRVSPVHFLSQCRGRTADNDNDHDHDDDDDGNDDLSSVGDVTEESDSQRHDSGETRTSSQTAIDVLTTPSVDIVFAAAMVGLLLHGPLRF